jgi:hypothetical protein
MEEMTANKTGVNADRADTAEQVDHARTDRFSWAKAEAKPAMYVANLLNVGRSALYRALVATGHVISFVNRRAAKLPNRASVRK